MVRNVELLQRLDAMATMINLRLRTDKAMSVDMERFLKDLKAVALFGDPEDYIPIVGTPNHIVISCDGSFKGSLAAVGFVIQNQAENPVSMAMYTPSKNSEEAEYDAIYEALRTFMGLCNRPAAFIEIRSDSQNAVNELNGRIKCNKNETLIRKRDSIRELVQQIPVDVRVVWMPRNSTTELKKANYLAEGALGVLRH